THVVPIANLIQDYPYNATPPAFTYIVPNLDNDAHNTNAKVGDTFLKGFVSQLVNQSWFSSTAIFITYDESGSPQLDTGYDGLAGGPVPMFAVSPYSVGIGAVDQTNTSHYNLLSTMEWLLGLPPTGTGNDGTPAFPPMKGLFNFGPPPPVGYPVSGVVLSDGGSPLAGVRVYANLTGNSSTTVTNQTGGFAFQLANGTYSVSAIAPGWVPAIANVTVAGAPVDDLGLALAAVTYPVSGVVVATNGSALAGFEVYANSTSNYSSTVTNSLGGFSLGLPNGEYTLSAEDSGWGPGEVNVTVAGAAVAGVRIGLSLRTFTIEGTVTNASSGLPVGNATVVVRNASSPVTLTTSSAGRFTVVLPAGDYPIYISAFFYDSTSSTLVVVPTDTSPSFALTPAPVFTVNGTIAITNGGSPVGNATLVFTSANGTFRANATGGTFSLTIPNGTYQLEVEATGFAPVVVQVVVAGDQVEPIRVVLGSTVASAAWWSNPVVLAAAAAAGISAVALWLIVGPIRRRPGTRPRTVPRRGGSPRPPLIGGHRKRSHGRQVRPGKRG
ncbi:MAG: carboxypeptidase regulatory-like domain-containing protein, partial [Thermoplasmata archaeon]